MIANLHQNLPNAMNFFLTKYYDFFAQLQFFKSITFCMIVLLYPPNRLSAHSMDFRIFCRLTARYQNLFICYCGLTYIVLLIMANLMITMQKNRKLYVQYSDTLFLIRIVLHIMWTLNSFPNVYKLYIQTLLVSVLRNLTTAKWIRYELALCALFDKRISKSWHAILWRQIYVDTLPFFVLMESQIYLCGQKSRTLLFQSIASF